MDVFAWRSRLPAAAAGGACAANAGDACLLIALQTELSVQQASYERAQSERAAAAAEIAALQHAAAAQPSDAGSEESESEDELEAIIRQSKAESDARVRAAAVALQSAQEAQAVQAAEDDEAALLSEGRAALRSPDLTLGAGGTAVALTVKVEAVSKSAAGSPPDLTLGAGGTAVALTVKVEAARGLTSKYADISMLTSKYADVSPLQAKRLTLEAQKMQMQLKIQGEIAQIMRDETAVIT